MSRSQEKKKRGEKFIIENVYNATATTLTKDELMKELFSFLLFDKTNIEFP